MNQNRKPDEKEKEERKVENGRFRGQGGRGPGWSSSNAIEREIQTRVTSALASAGVGPGRITLEVLYMLPGDFIKAYTRLFDSALEESVKGSGGVDARSTAKIGKRSASRQPNSRGAASGGAKRYRTHWLIRDEQMFKLKGSVDRKLIRLAGKIAREISRSRDSIAQVIECSTCHRDLTPLIEEFGSGYTKFCPGCGSGV